MTWDQKFQKIHQMLLWDWWRSVGIESLPNGPASRKSWRNFSQWNYESLHFLSYFIFIFTLQNIKAALSSIIQISIQTHDTLLNIKEANQYHTNQYLNSWLLVSHSFMMSSTFSPKWATPESMQPYGLASYRTYWTLPSTNLTSDWTSILLGLLLAWTISLYFRNCSLT